MHPAQIIKRSIVWTLLIALAFTTSSALAQNEIVTTDLDNLHIASGTALSSTNVFMLSQAWKVDTEKEVTHTPLMENGRVYFADWGGTVYAADATSGEVVWKNKVQDKVMEKWPWHGFAGTGVLGEGLLFEASVEGMAYGIDAETGEVKWQTNIADDDQAGNLSDLLYYDGLVYIGMQSVEEPLHAANPQSFKPDFQGYVLALDAQSGEQVWKRKLVEAPANGVPVWSSFALDPDMNALFFTTGNNYTGEPTELTDAVVAVDAKSGEILWAKQVTENDVWTGGKPLGPDFDFGAGPQLFEAQIDGQSRKLVGAGQKSGLYWAFDRETGDVVWQSFVGYGGVGGGIHSEASIKDGKVYVWSNNNYFYGQAPRENPMDVRALDAATGKYLWVKNKAQPAGIPSAGVLADDVYIVGSLDGTLKGYRATDGEPIWNANYDGAIATALTVVGNTLFFGTAVPVMFAGQQGGNGVVAYSLQGQVDLGQ